MRELLTMTGPGGRVHVGVGFDAGFERVGWTFDTSTGPGFSLVLLQRLLQRSAADGQIGRLGDWRRTFLWCRDGRVQKKG